MMIAEKILIFSALVAAIPVAYTKEASLWEQDVFPNDLSWLSPPRRVKKIAHDKNDEVDTEDYEICQTKSCMIIAEEFLSSMNRSVDPCDDFYEFSCGGWTAEDKIPPSSTSWSRLMIFQEVVARRIKEVLETRPEPTDILPVRQAKKWYRSCMDTEGLENRGLKPIESILMQAGGWPIAMDEEEWDPEEYTWQRVERYYAYLTGWLAFFEIEAIPNRFGPDANGKSFGTITVKSSSIPFADQLPLKYRNYSGNDYDSYVQLVERVVHLFVQHNRAHVSEERVRKEAKEIVEFEKEIYELRNSDTQFVATTFANFSAWYETNITELNEDPRSEIYLMSVIEELFGMVNIKIDPDTNMSVRHLGFIKGIGEILKKTPTRTIVNYVHWNFISGLLKYTTETLRDEIFQLVREEYGAKSRPPRWSECVSDIQMSHAAAYVFVKKYFTEDTETRALKMIKNIKLEMEKQIEDSNWLDEESKTFAKDKLNSMSVFLGFPDWYKNKTAVINYYKGLSIGTEYFDNVLSYMRYKRKINLKSYLSDGDGDEPWMIDPITVNALYNRHGNNINIPAVDLQPPLFTSSLPDYVNYGITGVIIGHEMGHGFDDVGIRISQYGNKTTLSKNILQNYYRRAECFLDQFEQYYGETRPPRRFTLPDDYIDMNYDSQRTRALGTRGENIADTTGIQAVFEAFKKHNKIEGSSKLPGFEEFTNDQLFFISYASMWCEVTTPQYEKKQKKTRNPHSPAKLRVIGSVSNTKDFAKVFNCPEGKPMNPTNKCSIWEKPGAVPKCVPVPESKTKLKHRPWGAQWNY